MKHLSETLADLPGSCVFGFNLGVVGAVHFSAIESALKIAVLIATLALTLLTAWIKWRNRDKPHE